MGSKVRKQSLAGVELKSTSTCSPARPGVSKGRVVLLHAEDDAGSREEASFPNEAP